MSISIKNRSPRTLSLFGQLAQLGVAVAVAGALFAACSSSTGPGQGLASYTVSPNATLAITATQQFTAVGKDINGKVVATTSPTWSVVAGGGTISSTGLFTAGLLAGTFTSTVKATSGIWSAFANVVVTAGSLATIVISPDSANLRANASQQFMAVSKDAAGNVVAITPTWSVVAGGGTISPTGLFTAGLLAGTFTNTVRATSGSVSGNVTIIVPSASHGPAPVVLGTAGTYAVLAKSGISTVPTSAITGNIGLSPAAASFITGFALNLPAGSAFSTSTQVTGNVYAANYAVPTPVNLTTAIGDMQTAYTDAAGRPTPDYSELAVGHIGGLTLTPGLYKWSSAVTIATDVTLTGSATDVWIFQIAGGVTQASATRVTLTGGALAKNVFWQVAGIMSIGTTAHMEGVVMSKTAITLNTGASANGRLLAQTAVTLAGNAIVEQ
jgi:hypothetical protein